MNSIQRAYYWLAAATLVLYLAVGSLALFGWISNNHRTNEIQSNRVFSCKATFQSYLSVFRPFFPKDKKQWNAKQKKDWQTLEETVKDLKAKCNRQVKVGA